MWLKFMKKKQFIKREETILEYLGNNLNIENDRRRNRSLLNKIKRKPFFLEKGKIK